MRKRKVVSNRLFPKSKDSAVNYLRCAKMRILYGKFQRPNLKFAIIHFVITPRAYAIGSRRRMHHSRRRQGCIGGKDSGGDRWFCPNGEHVGKTYNSWSEIPSSCFKSGVKPPWPPDEDPPPIQIPPYYRPTYAELLDALKGGCF